MNVYNRVDFQFPIATCASLPSATTCLEQPYLLGLLGGRYIQVLLYYFLDRILFHHDFYHESCNYYWDFYGHSFFLNYTFRLSVIKYLWFCKCATPSPWTFSLYIGINMLLSDSFISCLHSLLEYSTGEFQASQLIVNL